MMRKMDLLKKQDGIALVLVMITFMVIALLGAAVATAAVNEVKQAAVLDKDTRAYYKARSAADVVITSIQEKLIALKEQDDIIQGLLGGGGTEAEINAAIAVYDAMKAEFNSAVPENEGDPPGTVQVNNLDDIDSIQVYREGDYIVCEAEATVYDMSARAKVRIEQSSSEQFDSAWTETVQVPLFEEAIYANGDLEFNGSSNIVYGDVLYEGNLTKKTPNTPGYSCAKNNEDRPYLPLDPPTLDEGKTWTNTITIAQNGVYDKVDYTKKATINIDTKEKDNVKLHIKELNFSNKLEIIATGTGRVDLYVDKMNYAGGNSNLSVVSSDKNVPNVFLNLMNDVDFTLSGSDKFQCYLYAPAQTITFGGTIDICGSVIAGDFRSNGNLTVKYNPPSLDEDDGTVDQTIEHDVSYYRLGVLGNNSKIWLPEE